MRLGRTCHRLKEYSQLYSSSNDVQRALCNYYAAVVRVCQYSTESSRGSSKQLSAHLLPPNFFLFESTETNISGTTRLVIATFYSYEAQFSKYEAELFDLFGEVEKAIDLASKQKQDQDSSKITTIWDKILRDEEHSKRSLVEAADRKLKEKRLQALNSFSTYNCRKWYSQVRKECIPGTSAWICESDTFRTWVAGHSGTLWCCGRCKC